MSLLGDFAGSFLQIAGQQGMQREEEDRQLRLREALDARRRKINRQERNEDYVTEQNLGAKPYVGYDAQGKPGLLQDEFAMGEAGPSRNTRRLGDAPRTPTGEVERKVGDELVRYRQFSDGTEEVIAKAPRYKPDGGRGGGSGGSTAKPKYELRNIGGEVMRINVNDPGAKPQSIGPASKTGASKEDSADTIRSKWTAVATAINSAEGEALRSIAAQYGMDQRGLPTDDQTLKSALLAQVDAEFGKRLNGGDAKAEQPKQKDTESPPIAGAKKAEDGNWYVQKNGKWFKVEA